LEPLGIRPVVAGGTAVEFYTLGQYSTMDIDFIGIISDEMKKVMSEMGFKRDGRYWKIPDTDIMVEFPSEILEGNMDKVQPVEYQGRTAYFIGIEDLIINRCAEAKHWTDLSSEEWAANLLAAHYDEIDWSYCHKTANGLGCLDKFEEIQRRVKNIRRKNNRKT
jgi:hypothetical protein